MGRDTIHPGRVPIGNRVWCADEGPNHSGDRIDERRCLYLDATRGVIRLSGRAQDLTKLVQLIERFIGDHELATVMPLVIDHDPHLQMRRKIPF